MALFSSDEEKEEKQRLFVERTLERYNVFEGIECEVILPEKQLKISGKSGSTKALSTFAFGFVGYAATSATSHNEENRDLKTIFQIVDNGFVLKNANIDGSDRRIHFGEIVKMRVIDSKEAKDKSMGIITLLENKQVIIIPMAVYDERDIILNHISNIFKERSYGIKNEEPGWGLDSEFNGNKVSYDNSDVSKLERIGMMYEKGLLSEEEFKKLKKGIIEK